MLTQYRLALRPERDCAPRPEWAYHLYAALLALAPPQFGSEAHRNTVTPVSQFLQIRGKAELLWTVNLLGEESALLAPALEEATGFSLSKDGVCLSVVKRVQENIRDVEQLFSRTDGCSGRHGLHICTAAAFKSQGQYLNLPTARLIVQSLLKKWNGCFPECPIEDEDGHGMEALSAGLRCCSFRLYDRLYYLKGNSIPGFVGKLVLDNRLDGFHRRLADALLIFSGYAGIGIKTTLGMGGVEHRLLP